MAAMAGSVGSKEPIAEQSAPCFEDRTTLGERVVLGDQDLSDEFRGVY
jgi:hypothetical protein